MDDKQQEEILMDLMNKMYHNTSDMNEMQTNIEDIIAVKNDAFTYRLENTIYDTTRSKFDELELQIRTLVGLLRLNFKEIYKDKYLVVELGDGNKPIKCYIGKFKNVCLKEGIHYGLDRVMAIQGDESEYLFAGADITNLDINTFDDAESAKLYAECAD